MVPLKDLYLIIQRLFRCGPNNLWIAFYADILSILNLKFCQILC